MLEPQQSMISLYFCLLFYFVLRGVCSFSSSSVNSPRHGYKVRMSGGPLTNCDCSYHSRNNRASVESEEAAEVGSRATVAKDATE